MNDELLMNAGGLDEINYHRRTQHVAFCDGGNKMEEKRKNEGDDLVDLIKIMNNEEVRSRWFRYRLIAITRKQRLYRSRWQTFEEFARELGITRVMAHYYATIGEKLNIDEFSKLLDVWKAITLSRLPIGPARDELLAKAHQMSRKQITAAIRKIKTLKPVSVDHE
jgi:hypothetical protein